jgi:hypothetical protein
MKEKKKRKRISLLKWIPYSKVGKLSKEAPQHYVGVRYCVINLNNEDENK